LIFFVGVLVEAMKIEALYSIAEEKSINEAAD
jgi:hypothetical protein